MTHTTDEELENRNRKASAAMRGMHKTACYEQGDHPDECGSYFSLAADALDAITALRAQLAAANARADKAEAALTEAQLEAYTWEGRALHQNEVANREAKRADRAEAALAAQPLRSGWADVMSSAIQRFEVAAAVNGSATWNSIGSKAMAELLKELSRHVDRAKAALAAQIEVDAGIADDYTPEKHSGMTLQAHVTGRNIASAIRNQPHDRTALDRLLADAEAKALRKAADEMEDERAKQAILAMITKEGEA